MPTSGSMQLSSRSLFEQSRWLSSIVRGGQDKPCSATTPSYLGENETRAKRYVFCKVSGPYTPEVGSGSVRCPGLAQSESTAAPGGCPFTPSLTVVPGFRSACSFCDTNRLA
jgi:hypothetical protein